MPNLVARCRYCHERGYDWGRWMHVEDEAVGVSHEHAGESEEDRQTEAEGSERPKLFACSVFCASS